MKKWVTLALVLIATTAAAENVSYKESAVYPGDQELLYTSIGSVVGVGYAHHQAEWDGFDIEQNRAFLQVGVAGEGRNEPRFDLYLRVGAADLETDDIVLGESFDADYEPYAAAGLRVDYLPHKMFGIGLEGEGAYFASWEDEVLGADVKVEETWELEASIPVSCYVSPVTIYAGPMFYISKGDLEIGDINLEEEFEEEGDFGYLGGISLDFGRLKLDGRVEDKSDLSIIGLVTYAF